MNPHNLPPLPPIGQPPSTVATHTNPGLVDVASQCYPPPPQEQVISTGKGLAETVKSDFVSHAKSLPPTVAVSTAVNGLAADERPDSVSHVHLSPPTIAITTTPATTQEAGTFNATGLPTNVMIR